MNAQRDLKILESMMRWTREVQPGRAIVETKWKPHELKAMGLFPNEGGKYHHTVNVNGFDIRFQVLPRKP